MIERFDIPRLDVRGFVWERPEKVRTFYDVRWYCNGVFAGDVSIALMREVLQEFALNATDADIRLFAEKSM